MLAELGTVPLPSDTVQWDDRRVVEIAAAASRNAAATPRLEIYPRRLPLVRALRLTQAGLVPLIPGQRARDAARPDAGRGARTGAVPFP